MKGADTKITKAQEIKDALDHFSREYAKMINKGGGNFDLPKVKSQVYKFFDSKPLPEQKVKLNVIIRKLFRNYLTSQFVCQIEKNIKSSDRDVFIDQLANFWDNYQRFAFAINIITEKGDIFYKTFNSAPKFYHLTDGAKNQVGPVSVLAVSELNSFVQRLRILQRYSDIFCAAIARERQGKVVQSQKIRDALLFFQACHFDFDAIFKKVEGNKPTISKTLNNETKYAFARHSTADAFFQKEMLPRILDKCQEFYKKFVIYEATNLDASVEILKMIEFLNNQDSRGRYYIHEDTNFKTYIECVHDNLIAYKIEERINKASGLSRYLEMIDVTKEEYFPELKKFWQVYSRIYNISKEFISKIYSNYFMKEGEIMIGLVENRQEFITSAVNLNLKNQKIVSTLGNMLDFDRIRVESIQKILSCEMVKGNKFFGKFLMGAKSLTAALNNEIKKKCSKDEKYGEQQEHLMGLFNIFKYKTVAIKEHSKLLNQRLLEDLDISKDAKLMNALQLEQRIIEEIRKQAAENDVKNLQQCIKDINKSEQITNELKSLGLNKKFPFFNQIIIKNNTFWNENTFFDIEPPTLILNCKNQALSQIQNKHGNVQFQLFNGVSTIRYEMGPKKFNFSIKNIYAIILLMIDERPTKKMFYSEIIDRVKPSGRLVDKSYLELSQYLVELTHHGLLLSNKSLKEGTPNLQKCEGSDWFEINKKYTPTKKAAMYKTKDIAMLPKFIGKAFQDKRKVLDDENKEYEKERRIIIEAHCVKILKHAHHDGGGTVTLDNILDYFTKEPKTRELNAANPRIIKQILESLINKKYCDRVEGKKNTFQYKA